MARPRKHIRIKNNPDGSLTLLPKDSKDGMEIHGLSVHSNGTFYSNPAPGEYKYWGKDLKAAIAGYRLSFLNVADMLGAIHADRMAGIPKGYHTIKDHMADTNTHVGRLRENQNRAYYGKPQLPPLNPDDLNTVHLPAPVPQTLKDVKKAFEEIKHDEGCQQLYINKVTLVADRFIKAVRNKSISHLTADDFAQWRRHIQTATAKDKQTNLWYNDNHRRLKTLFKDVLRERPSWEFPRELPLWLDAWKAKKHLADKHNKQRMPLDVYNKLLAKATEWSNTDVESLPTKTQKQKGKKLQAERKRIEGLRWIAILKLACNCALDNVDCRRITWDAIKTDGKIPYMDFARIKSERQVGNAVERKTPLLPSTVKALEALRKVQPFKGHIFRTARGGGYSHMGFYNAYLELAEQAGIEGWTFKHLRNVAPSVGRDGKRGSDERDALLGHVVDGVSRYYTDEFNESYLLDLINLVGKAYFNGETIKA